MAKSKPEAATTAPGEISDKDRDRDRDRDITDIGLDNKDATSLFTTEHMDILNDVDMQITVEIGRTKMRIADLLSLKRGAVIELPQAAEEPLQIYASDKLIAKGQIVSTQGKYFIKIM